MTDEIHTTTDDIISARPQPETPSVEAAMPLATAVLDQNLDDTNPDETIQARPQWGGVSMLAAVQSLGGIVPGAGIIEAAYSNMFRAVEMHGLFSISNGGGSLQEYFLEQNGIVDDEGRKRDRDDDDNLSFLADMVADQREEQRREQRERDVEATFSESQIDAMSWVGDPDQTWTIDGVTASRKELLAGAKSARKGLKKVATEHGWNEDKLDHETRLVSDYERAIKENRLEDAAKAKQEMQPETKELIKQQTHTELAASSDVSANTAKAAVASSSNMSVSSSAGADVLIQMAAADNGSGAASIAPVRISGPIGSTGLSHPPDIELTQEFSLAASNTDASPKPQPPAVVASVSPPLDQGFSI